MLDTQLGKTGSFVAGDYPIADIACSLDHDAQGAGFTLDDYPERQALVRRSARPPAGAGGLAIGKFVKEPFDEEARKNMFGQKAKEMSKQKQLPSFRACASGASSDVHCTSGNDENDLS